MSFKGSGDGAEEERGAHDIEMPILSPVLVRKKSLAQEIGDLDVLAFDCPVLPFKQGDDAEETFV